jgi:hypothetical protein
MATDGRTLHPLPVPVNHGGNVLHLRIFRAARQPCCPSLGARFTLPSGDTIAA